MGEHRVVMVGGLWAKEHPDEMVELRSGFDVKLFDWNNSAAAIDSVRGLHIDAFIGRLEWMNIFSPLARALSSEGIRIRHFIGIQPDDTDLPPTALRETGVCASVGTNVAFTTLLQILNQVLDHCPAHVDFMEFVDRLELLVKFFDSDELTSLDRQILQLLSSGCTDNEIAHSLHYSNQTIRNHISSILRASGLRNRTELALRWKQHVQGTTL